MAASLRPTLLRHALAAPTKRSITTSILPAFRARQIQPVVKPSLALQRATFQTTATRSLLPALPQTVKGTVNDAAPVPEPEPTHGSYHWSFERAVSVFLVPVTMVPFAAGVGNPYLDSALIAAIILHTYMGFTSIITDYLPKWRVPFWRKLLEWGNFFAMFVVGWGFYEFETNDVGLTEGIKRIWSA